MEKLQYGSSIQIWFCDWYGILELQKVLKSFKSEVYVSNAVHCVQ